MEKRIINSVIDNDLYKFTMMFAVLHLFPRQVVSYKFTDRSGTKYPKGFDKKLSAQLKMMEELSLTKDEKSFLGKKCGDFLPPTFLDFLEGYRFDSSEVKVSLDDDGKLDVFISGYWYRTILWEVVIMAIISELYFIETGQEVDLNSVELLNNDTNKVNKLTFNQLDFTDFGTRRRFSFENQKRIVELFKEKGGKNFIGSSNVYFAYLYDLTPIGTHAHEWFMVHAAIYGYKMANTMSLNNWVEVYGGQLGIALSDTFTTEAFFNSFDIKLAKLFDGVRHDSGCPFEFTDKVIAHYEKLGIDPKSKTIVFSDGLDTDLAIEIKHYCDGVIGVSFKGGLRDPKGEIKSSFGIGTHFTNDVGVTPLKIVIKIHQVLVNGVWVDAVKLSDDLGKNTGNTKEVELCKDVLKII